MKDKWISVEDEMPKPMEYILVCFKDSSNIDMGYIYDYRNGELSWSSNNYNAPGWEDITHWQPLPEPPLDT